MEDTEDEDSDRVTTPDLVRALSDLVPYGNPVESLDLVLESSDEENMETTMEQKKEEEQQQPEKEEQKQQPEQSQMASEEEDIGDGYYLIRMFGEEHDMDDSFVIMPSSSDSSMSE